MATGLVKAGDKYYYFNTDGTTTSGGWITIEEKQYYFNSDGSARTGWAEIDGLKYYFLENGRMGTGVTKVGDKYYYFNRSGQTIRVGFIDYGDKRYYVLEDGTLAVGKMVIDGKEYNFGSDAALYVADTGDISMFEKAQNYSSKTGYLIITNKTKHLVNVYKGSKGNWELVKSFVCTVGAARSQTIEGEFEVGTKLYYFDSGSCRVFYATRIKGAYFFHSVLYYQTRTPQRLMDARLGMNLSHGCVRLALENAKWIYDNVPTGTKIVIYR